MPVEKKPFIASEEVFKIINNSSIVIVVWQNTAGLSARYATDNFEELAGYPPDELVSGKIKITDIIHPDDFIRVRNEVYSLGLKNNCTEFDHKDYRIITKGGEIRWVKDKTYITRDESNNIVHFQSILSDITRQKETDNLLRITRFIYEKASIGIFRSDVDGNIIDVNEKVSEMLGYTKEEMCHLTIPDIDPSVDFEELRRTFVGLPGGAETYMESVHRKKNGVDIPVEIYGNTLEYNGKKYIISFSRDITVKKINQKKYKDNLLKLQTIYNNLPVIVWMTDNKGVHTFLEGKYLSKIDIKPEELLGHSIWDIYKDRPVVIENHKRVLKGEACDYEIELGGIIFHSILTPVLDEAGKVQGVSGITIDVTEKRKAEEELRHLRNYLSNIINSMPSILIGVDSAGRITQWNKTAEDNTAISTNTAYGKKLSDALPQMSREMEKINRAIKSRQIIREQKRSGTVYRNADFEDMTIFPLITNGVEGAVIRLDDITQKVRMEEMMIQSEKMLSVGGLAAGMAHEINNPLAGMIQTISVMKDRLQDNPNIPANQKAADELGISMEIISKYMDARKIPKMINSLVNSGKCIVDIIDNMLSFARKSENISSSENLGNLMDKTLELAGTDFDLKKNWDFRNIIIRKEYAPDLMTVPCEGAKIQQVLLNLLRNGAQAMQYAEIKEPAFAVRLYNDTSGNMVNIEIEDNGPGMPEEISKRIFEPFYTTKPAGVGTGLGLSVSYFIVVENHGGEMDVDSTPGKGTRFTVRLPVKGGG